MEQDVPHFLGHAWPLINSPTLPLKAERMSAAVILLTGNLATCATCRAFLDSSVTGPKKDILTEVPQGLKFLSHCPLRAFAEERIRANCEAGLQCSVG